MIHHRRKIKIYDGCTKNFVPKSHTIEGQTFPYFSLLTTNCLFYCMEELQGTP